MTAADFIIKPFRVFVPDYGSAVHYARSRGKALADAWRCDAFNGWTFKDFMKAARARNEPAPELFGDPITVGKKPAFYVRSDSQYIHFVRPGCDVILNSHPLDVEPPEYRKGTPYYQAGEPQ